MDNTPNISNPIYLENSCQQGNEIGYTLEELAEIWHSFDKKYHKRLGFCLDTCHAFVAGMLQFIDEEEVDTWFRRFDMLIGLRNLKVIHFNDSKTPFNGHNDHHHDLLQGYITNPDYNPLSTAQKKKPGPLKRIAQITDSENKLGDDFRGTVEGLKRVVSWAKKLKIPLILETPRELSSCQEQIEILNEWHEEVSPPDYTLIKKSQDRKIIFSGKIPKKK